MSKISALCALFLVVLLVSVFSACGAAAPGNTATDDAYTATDDAYTATDGDYTAAPENQTPEDEAASDTTSLAEILANPISFVSDPPAELTIAGVVSTIRGRFFYIADENQSAELMINFIGSQAFPELGDEIVISGTFIQNC